MKFLLNILDTRIVKMIINNQMKKLKDFNIYIRVPSR